MQIKSRLLKYGQCIFLRLFKQTNPITVQQIEIMQQHSLT